MERKTANAILRATALTDRATAILDNELTRLYGEIESGEEVDEDVLDDMAYFANRLVDTAQSTEHRKIEAKQRMRRKK